jgi:hypothetical protein
LRLQSNVARAKGHLWSLWREQRPFGFHSHKTGLEKLTCFYNELFK